MVTRMMVFAVLVFALAAGVASLSTASAQVAAPRGQNIAPVYEGWEKNADGSFNLLFGYFNRNWDEWIDIPVGPDNHFEPGGPDYGQPHTLLPPAESVSLQGPSPCRFRRQGASLDADESWRDRASVCHALD